MNTSGCIGVIICLCGLLLAFGVGLHLAFEYSTNFGLMMTGIGMAVVGSAIVEGTK